MTNGNSTDTIELLRELRLVANAGDLPPKGHPGLAQRAADEIERLQRIIAEYKAREIEVARRRP